MSDILQIRSTDLSVALALQRIVRSDEKGHGEREPEGNKRLT